MNSINYEHKCAHVITGFWDTVLTDITLREISVSRSQGVPRATTQPPPQCLACFPCSGSAACWQTIPSCQVSNSENPPTQRHTPFPAACIQRTVPCPFADNLKGHPASEVPFLQGQLRPSWDFCHSPCSPSAQGSFLSFHLWQSQEHSLIKGLPTNLYPRVYFPGNPT